MDHDPAMTFGMKLKLLARARGMSRDEILAGVIAQGVELSKSALGNYFADVNMPQLETALALARTLRVPLDYLADAAMDQVPVATEGGVTPEERAVLAIYRHRRRLEGERFTPEELAWRCEVERYADPPGIASGDEPGPNSSEASGREGRDDPGRSGLQPGGARK